MLTTTEPSIRVYFFKDSREELLSLLSVRGIDFVQRPPTPGAIMASGEWVEILNATAGVLVPLAGVVVAYLKFRPRRKVIITLKDRGIVHAENLTESDLALVLDKAESITAFDPRKNESGDTK